jgi:hypothetical protein
LAAAVAFISSMVVSHKALCLVQRLSSTTHSLSVSAHDAVSQVLDVRSLLSYTHEIITK